MLATIEAYFESKDDPPVLVAHAPTLPTHPPTGPTYFPSILTNPKTTSPPPPHPPPAYNPIPLRPPCDGPFSCQRKAGHRQFVTTCLVHPQQFYLLSHIGRLWMPVRRCFIG